MTAVLRFGEVRFREGLVFRDSDLGGFLVGDLPPALFTLAGLAFHGQAVNSTVTVKNLTCTWFSFRRRTTTDIRNQTKVYTHGPWSSSVRQETEDEVDTPLLVSVWNSGARKSMEANRSYRRQQPGDARRREGPEHGLEPAVLKPNRRRTRAAGQTTWAPRHA